MDYFNAHPGKQSLMLYFTERREVNKIKTIDEKLGALDERADLPPVGVVIRNLHNNGSIPTLHNGDLCIKGETPEPEMENNLMAQAEAAREHLKRQFDPRPDKEEDAHLWQEVLRTAWESFNLELHGLLQGMRYAGCRLVFKDGRLELKPPTNEDELRWFDEEEWPDMRKEWLIPKTKEITALFNVVQDELIDGKSA